MAWEALEEAFENNAPEVHSYLHVESGDVLRIVDGTADPGMHSRVMGDPLYLRIDPVSSREQYRWMERFITSVEDEDLRSELAQSIDGKGAFRRFKDVLMSHAVERERWFVFRSERLRAAMSAWLQAHGIEAVARAAWQVPSPEDVQQDVPDESEVKRVTGPLVGTAASVIDHTKGAAEPMRNRLMTLAARLPGSELESAVAFLEFLAQRKPVPSASLTRLDPEPVVAEKVAEK